MKLSKEMNKLSKETERILESEDIYSEMKEWELVTNQTISEEDILDMEKEFFSKKTEE